MTIDKARFDVLRAGRPPVRLINCVHPHFVGFTEVRATRMTMTLRGVLDSILLELYT